MMLLFVYDINIPKVNITKSSQSQNVVTWKWSEDIPTNTKYGTVARPKRIVLAVYI